MRAVSPERFIDPDALEHSLAALRARSDQSGLMETMQQVMDATRDLFGASGAGVMMIDDQSALSAVAATDEPGRLLEVRQQEVGHGPCVDSLMFDHVVTTDDLATDERWPELGRELAAAGVRAVLGIPIHAGNIAVGSLNVYRDEPGRWTDSEAAALKAYARLIETILATALKAEHHERLTDQLQHALEHRVVIERAVGVIMGRQNLDAVTAFNQMRRTARSSERKVADIAVELLAGVGDYADESRPAAS
jgi:GAF domain-containing protein